MTESLLTFPARFPIKIMGKNDAALRSLVRELAEALPPEDFISLSENTSKNGQYLAFTLTAIFHNQASIDAIYQQLSASPLVTMAL